MPSPPGRVSVVFGQHVDDLEPVVEYARLCQARDVRLWLGQSVMIESHAALAAVAGRGISIETGLGVAVAPLRTPVDAFTQARSVASLMGRPIAAGYGMGTAEMAGRLLGRELTAPAAYMASYVEQMQGMKQTPEDSSESDGTSADAKAVDVGCGVLRPRMAREAGRVADFVITWLTPLDYIAATLCDALDAGAASAQRTRRPRIVSVVQCALSGAERDPARLALIGCGRHVRAPHYADMLRRAGIDITGDHASDLRAALRSGLYVYGSAADIAATVNSYWQVGVDEVVLNVSSVGMEHGTSTALHDVEQILDEVERTRTNEFPSTGR